MMNLFKIIIAIFDNYKKFLTYFFIFWGFFEVNISIASDSIDLFNELGNIECNPREIQLNKISISANELKSRYNSILSLKNRWISDSPDRMSNLANIAYLGWINKNKILNKMKEYAYRGNPDAQYLYANMLIEKAGPGEELSEAFGILRCAAKQKYMPAIYLLGQCYENAINCFVDYNEAAKWYSLLLEDYIYKEDATLHLSYCYIQQKKFKEAQLLLEPYLKNENAMALYLTFIRIKKEENQNYSNISKKALYYCILAHKKGNLDASCALAEYYFWCKFSDDRKLKNLYKKVPELLKNAIKVNHQKALWIMNLYSKNSNDAQYYFEKSAEYGNVYNRVQIATFDLEDKHYSRALKWLKPCVLKKDASALFLLGIMYSIGQGVPKNFQKAWKYITMAKSQGYDPKLCDDKLKEICLRRGAFKQDFSYQNEKKKIIQIIPQSISNTAIDSKSSFGKLLSSLCLIQDSTDSFEKAESNLNRIIPAKCKVGNCSISKEEMEFLLTIFKLEYCSVLRKGRKTIIYAEQLEYILKNHKINQKKLSNLLWEINLNAMIEVGLARAEIIKGTPEKSFIKIKNLLNSLSKESSEYHMVMYTLACLYLKKETLNNNLSIPLYKEVLEFFIKERLNAYAAIVSNRLALALRGTAEQKKWLDLSEILADETSSKLVHSEYLLQLILAWSNHCSNPENVKEMSDVKKKEIILMFEKLRNDFLAISTSDYYLVAAYFYFALFDYGMGYPIDAVLKDIEKHYMYKSLVYESTNFSLQDSSFYIEKIINDVMKNLAETKQIERLNYWTLHFEKIRIRQNNRTNKMSVLTKMVSRLENANQIISIEQNKPTKNRDEKLILMALEVKKELERYFDTLKYRLSEKDKYKFEKILKDSFIIDPNSLRQLSNILPEKCACVQIIPAGESIIIYITTKENTPFVYVVSLKDKGLSSKKLYSCVGRARIALQNNLDINQINGRLQKLYSVIWADLEAPLRAMHIEKIIVNSSGNLRYIPFAALFDGVNYLVEKYQITSVTGLDLIRLSLKSPAKEYNLMKAVVFADPDGSLPFARREGQNIASMFIKNEFHFGEKASLDKFESLLGNVNFIHLATHAILDPDSPEDSYILFSNGEQWRYADMNSFNIKNIDSFVLSACSTAMGEKSNGCEIEGMAYNLLCKSPAGSVLASYWNVDDRATSDLMSIYYKHIVESIKKTKLLDRGGALRDAQLSLLHNKNTASPYYWAAFTLFGDFR